MINRRLVLNTALFAITLLGIQGTAYSLQLLAAYEVEAATYSVIRLIESSASVGGLIITFGVPSAVLVTLSAARSRLDRVQNVLASLFLIVAFAAFLAIAAFGVSLLLGYRLDHAAVISALSLLISLRLLLTSVAQAGEEFKTLAYFSLIGCAIAFVVFFGLRQRGIDGLTCWVAARLTVEGAFVACMAGKRALAFVRNLSPHNIKQLYARDVLRAILALSLPVGASLVIRALVEHGPILWLAASGASPLIVARVGIVITLGTIALIPGSILQGVILPRLARSSGSSELRKAIVLLGAVSALTGIIFIAIAMLADMLFAWAALFEISILLAGAVMVIAKMVASSAGGLLLISRKGRTILLLNSTTLMTFSIIAITLRSPIREDALKVGMIVGIIALIETAAATFYLKALHRNLRSRLA